MTTWTAPNRRLSVLPLLVTGALVLGCGGDDGGEAEQAPAQGDAQGEQAAGVQGQSLEEFIRADFEQVDDDGSGTASLGEAQEAIRADFKAMDLDGDGVLTVKDVQQELDRSGGGDAGGSLSDHLPHDTNGDDKITEREYLEEVLKQTHEPMDTDGDGVVSADEAVAFHTARARDRR